jgi:hypothetical protein
VFVVLGLGMSEFASPPCEVETVDADRDGRTELVVAFEEDGRGSAEKFPFGFPFGRLSRSTGASDWLVRARSGSELERRALLAAEFAFASGN